MYFVGELGYEHDAEFVNKEDAISYAKEESIAAGLNPIAILNDAGEVVVIAVEGEIFIKQN